MGMRGGEGGVLLDVHGLVCLRWGEGGVDVVWGRGVGGCERFEDGGLECSCLA